jgi:hypothetical protein
MTDPEVLNLLCGVFVLGMCAGILVMLFWWLVDSILYPGDRRSGK